MKGCQSTGLRFFGVGMVLALLALPANARRLSERDQTATQTKQEDTDVFTGTIQSVDVQLHTVTVTGHEVLRAVTIKHTGKTTAEKTKPPKKAAAAKPKAAADAARTFRLDPLCKIAVAGNALAVASDLKTGQAVDVAYHVLSDNTAVADTITPPQPAAEK